MTVSSTHPGTGFETPGRVVLGGQSATRAGSPLVRATVAAGDDVALVATCAGTRALERRVKGWHKTT